MCSQCCINRWKGHSLHISIMFDKYQWILNKKKREARKECCPALSPLRYVWEHNHTDCVLRILPFCSKCVFVQKINAKFTDRVNPAAKASWHSWVHTCNEKDVQTFTSVAKRTLDDTWCNHFPLACRTFHFSSQGFLHFLGKFRIRVALSVGLFKAASFA